MKLLFLKRESTTAVQTIRIRPGATPHLGDHVGKDHHKSLVGALFVAVVDANRNHHLPPIFAGRLLAHPSDHMLAVNGAPDGIGNHHQIQPGLVNTHQ